MNPCIALRRARTIVLPALILAALARPTPAEVPAGPAAFAPGATLTNPWVPFQAGAVSVYQGRAHGQGITAIETHLLETRTFEYDGQVVTCQLIEELEFEAGALVDASLNALGEDVDGNVWYFGEISTSYEDGVPVSHEGSWLVGGPTLPGDPPETLTVPAPMLFMPAQPAEGDVFVAESLPDEQEIITILDVQAKVKTPAGNFSGALKLREDEGNGEPAETQWRVQGLGVVRETSQGESLRLRATTLVKPEP
jgi:hypothetical protein